MRFGIARFVNVIWRSVIGISEEPATASDRGRTTYEDGKPVGFARQSFELHDTVALWRRSCVDVRLAINGMKDQQAKQALSGE
jgi:hypothetical protein